MYLRVVFDNFELDWASKTSGKPYPCNYQTYFRVGVRDVMHYPDWGWGGPIYKKLTCGMFSIADLFDEPEPLVIVIPLRVTERVREIPIYMEFEDDFSGKPLAIFHEYPDYAPDEAGTEIRWDKCSISKTVDYTSEVAGAHITYSYAYYPNKCADLPPPTP